MRDINPIIRCIEQNRNEGISDEEIKNILLQDDTWSEEEILSALTYEAGDNVVLESSGEGSLSGKRGYLFVVVILVLIISLVTTFLFVQLQKEKGDEVIVTESESSGVVSNFESDGEIEKGPWSDIELSSGFYYLKESQKETESEYYDEVEGEYFDWDTKTIEVVRYRPGHNPATSTLVALEEGQVGGYSVGRGGKDPVLFLESEGNILLFSATNSDYAVFTDLFKKDPPQWSASNFFLLPHKYHRLVYMAYVDNWLLYEYDYPTSQGKILSNELVTEVGGIPVTTSVQPVYYDETSDTLWLVNDGNSFSTVFKYSYNTGLLEKKNVVDPDGNLVGPCIRKKCRYYDFKAVINDGVVVGYRDSATNDEGLFKISFQDSGIVTTELPSCSMWSGNVLTSNDGESILCQMYKLTSDPSFESIIQDDSFIFEYERTAINTKSIESRLVSMNEETVSNLFGEEKDRLDEESYAYFLGLGLPTVAYQTGEWALGWLDEETFLTLKHTGTRMAQEDDWSEYDQYELSINNFKGNREVIDSGEWEFTYLGNLAE